MSYSKQQFELLILIPYLSKCSIVMYLLFFVISIFHKGISVCVVDINNNFCIEGNFQIITFFTLMFGSYCVQTKLRVLKFLTEIFVFSLK